MGSDSSKLKHSKSSQDAATSAASVPSIKLPTSATFYEGMTEKCEPEMTRSRNGSTASKASIRHPLSNKMRRLIQGCFSNPHETVGRRIMKRACDQREDFLHFFTSLEPEQREELEETMKWFLKKVVTNIDFVDEVQRLSEEFGQKFGQKSYRACGFRADLFAILADATIKECTHLDSAVHKAHTTTEAFSTFGQLVFSSVRDGFYTEVRRIRRASNSFSTGSNGSFRKKKSPSGTPNGTPTGQQRTSINGVEENASRGNTPRSSFSRSGSTQSDSPENSMEFGSSFLKPPSSQMLATRSY